MWPWACHRTPLSLQFISKSGDNSASLYSTAFRISENKHPIIPSNKLLKFSKNCYYNGDFLVINICRNFMITNLCYMSRTLPLHTHAKLGPYNRSCH